MRMVRRREAAAARFAPARWQPASASPHRAVGPADGLPRLLPDSGARALAAPHRQGHPPRRRRSRARVWSRGPAGGGTGRPSEALPVLHCHTLVGGAEFL